MAYGYAALQTDPKLNMVQRGGFVISDTRTETITLTEHSFKMKNYCTVFQAETADSESPHMT